MKKKLKNRTEAEILRWPNCNEIFPSLLDETGYLSSTRRAKLGYKLGGSCWKWRVEKRKKSGIASLDGTWDARKTWVLKNRAANMECRSVGVPRSWAPGFSTEKYFVSEILGLNFNITVDRRSCFLSPQDFRLYSCPRFIEIFRGPAKFNFTSQKLE